jgi:phytoene synthase
VSSTSSCALVALASTQVDRETSRDACLAVLAEHSKSFALAGRLLPVEARRDAAALYAWCRYADDLIDLASTDEQAHNLARLERELDAVFAGTPQSRLVLRAFQEVATERGIPRHYPQELLAGMRMDVEGARYETLDDLLLYCFRVAGVVGLMMCHVLGVSDARALSNAAHLGIGMQLTNVCRDVLEDWERGRLYLPGELLRAAGSPRLDPSPGASFPESAQLPVARVVERLLALAESYYASAQQGVAALDARSAFAVRTAALVYSAIGRELSGRGFDPLSGRAVVSTRSKLLLALRAALLTLADLPDGAHGPTLPRRGLPLMRYHHDHLPR